MLGNKKGSGSEVFKLQGLSIGSVGACPNILVYSLFSFVVVP